MWSCPVNECRVDDPARDGFRSSATPVKTDKTKSERPPEDVVRELKSESRKAEDYRERSLAIHGLICARCAREFDASTRHLLTVHHKDGNHLNNPPDGSNWENLCVYCHEDAHSRELLGDFISGEGKKECSLVFGGGGQSDSDLGCVQGVEFVR